MASMGARIIRDDLAFMAGRAGTTSTIAAGVDSTMRVTSKAAESFAEVASMVADAGRVPAFR